MPLRTMCTVEKKEKLLQKWGRYWVAVGQDYKEVFLDLIKESKNRPLRAIVYISGIFGFIYLIKTNPSERDFRNELQLNLNDSGMLGKKIRNPNVDAQFCYLSDCYNNGLIRRLSLGFCSLIWIDNYAECCGIYKATCPYLKPGYLTFYERIIDVGLLNTWWILQRKKRDFDFNLEELPER